MRPPTILLLALGCPLWLVMRDHAVPQVADREPTFDTCPLGERTAKRSRSDPRVAHVLGIVLHAGKPVAAARLEATVHPTGYHWTTDKATTRPDGTFDLAITAGDLDARQLVDVVIEAGPEEGYTELMVAPGDVVRGIQIEVGVGVRVSGRIVDGEGRPVTRYGFEPVGVCVGPRCARPGADGSFTLTSVQLGRDRVRAVAGGGSYAVSDLPLTSVAPSIVTADLSGTIEGIVLHVDGEAARAKYDNSGRADRTHVGSVHARVLLARGGTMPNHLGCWGDPCGGAILLGGDAMVRVPIFRQAGHTRIVCEADGFVRVIIEDPDPAAAVDIPLITRTHDAIDLGAELRWDRDGVRVVDVADEARHAGLRPDDLVTAVDGIAVARMYVNTVRELAFRLPPGESSTLTVVRRGTASTIRVRAPEDDD